MLPFNVWAQSLWETLYMVIVSTVISYAIGLPLGLTLVVTDKGGIRPMPVVNTVLGVVVNIMRSIPFLILAVMITPITRAIVGKAIAARPHGDDSRNGHALLLPAGEQVRRVQTVVIHPDELQCLVHASADFLRGNAEVLRRKGNILFYDVGDHLIIGILEHHADRAADVDQKRLVGRVHAVDVHLAAVRLYRRRDRAERAIGRELHGERLHPVFRRVLCCACRPIARRDGVVALLGAAVPETKSLACKAVGRHRSRFGCDSIRRKQNAV